jgi:hypothetical protein
LKNLTAKAARKSNGGGEFLKNLTSKAARKSNGGGEFLKNLAKKKIPILVKKITKILKLSQKHQNRINKI